MASSRVLELILKLSNQASNDLQKLKADLQSLSTGVNVALNFGQAQQQTQAIAQGLQGISQQASQAAQAVGQAAQGQRQASQGAGGWLEGITRVTFAFNQVSQAIGTVLGVIQQVGGAIYSTLLAPVEQFNAQILSSQTNLASASRIFVNGIEQIDPTAKIQSTGAFVRDLLKQVERDTEALVGVTSQEVFGITDILIRNSAQIQGQFDTSQRTYKDALASLTKGFAAELKVSGIPFFQASQEISSLFRGDITQDSLIAKKLGLANPDIAKLKGQGKLVEEILTRLQNSVAGNAIAATSSISGPLSNIQDFLQRLAREAGQPLFQPLVDGLNQVFTTLKGAEQAIFTPIVDLATQVGKVFGDLVSGAGSGLVEIFGRLQPGIQSLQGAFTALGETVAGVFQGSGGEIGNLLVEVGNAAASLTGALLNLAGTGLTAVIKAFDLLVNNPVSDFLRDIVLNSLAAIAKGIGVVAQLANGILTIAFDGLLRLFSAVAARGQDIVNVFNSVAGAIASGLSPLKPLLEPIQAIVADAVAQLRQLGEEIIKVGNSRNLDDTRQAIEGLNGSTNVLEGESRRYAKTLQELNAAEKANGKLSDEQIKKRKELQRLGSAALTDISRQIKELEGKRSTDASLNNAIDLQINRLKAAQKGLEGSGTETEKLEFQANALEELGTSYEQLSRRADQALRTLRSGGSREESAKFQKEASNLVKLTQQQVELGQISREEAEKYLSEVAQSTKVEVDTRQSAQDAIAKIRKQGLDQEIKDIDTQIAQIELAAQTGQKTQVQAIEETTALRKQQLDLQLKDVQTSIAAEQEAIEKGRGSKTKLADLERQEKTLTVQLAKTAADGAAKIQEQRIAAIDRNEQEATRRIKAAETQRQIDTQNLINQGLLTREEADQRRLASTRRTLDEELAAEKESLAKLEALPKASDPKTERDRQLKIQESRQRTGEITLKIAENEQQQQRALTQAIQSRIDRELQGYKNLQQAATNSLNAQKSLLEATQQLDNALTQSTQTRYNIAINALESQFAEEDRLKASAEKRLELQQKLAKATTPEEQNAALKELQELDRLEARQKQVQLLKIEAKQAELAALDRQFEMELRILEINQKQAQIEAQSAAAQARADQAKVLADRTSTKEQRDAAALQVQAATERVNSLKELQALQRQATLQQQQDKQLSARAELANLLPGGQQEAQIGKEALKGARQARSQARSQGDNLTLAPGTVTIDVPAQAAEKALKPIADAARQAPLDSTTNKQVAASEAQMAAAKTAESAGRQQQAAASSLTQAGSALGQSGQTLSNAAEYQQQAAQAYTQANQVAQAKALQDANAALQQKQPGSSAANPIDLKGYELFDADKAELFTKALDDIRRNILENPLLKGDRDKQLIEATKLASRNLNGSDRSQFTLKALNEVGLNQAVDLAVARETQQRSQLGGAESGKRFLSKIQRETNTFEFGQYREYFTLGLGQLSQQFEKQSSQFDRLVDSVSKLAQTAAVPRNISLSNVRDPIGTIGDIYSQVSRFQAGAAGL